MQQQDIELGATYRDVVSGFTGWVYSVTHFPFACSRVCLQDNEHLKDGQPLERVFDAVQLVQIAGRTPEVEAAMRAVGALPPAADDAFDTAAGVGGGDHMSPSMHR